MGMKMLWIMSYELWYTGYSVVDHLLQIFTEHVQYSPQTCLKHWCAEKSFRSMESLSSSWAAETWRISANMEHWSCSVYSSNLTPTKSYQLSDIQEEFPGVYLCAKSAAKAPVVSCWSQVQSSTNFPSWNTLDHSEKEEVEDGCFLGLHVPERTNLTGKISAHRHKSSRVGPFRCISDGNHVIL